MTENGAIEEIKSWTSILMSSGSKCTMETAEAQDMAISALTEIQQYRAIGTVEQFRQLSEQFKPHATDKTSCPNRGCNKCDKYRKENEKYHAIGTVEECRAAVEKVRDYEKQYIDDMSNPLEPLKVSNALSSEFFKLNYRKKNKPEEINVLDYTIIAALQKALGISWSE